MTDAPNKSPKAKAAPPNYCEALGRSCRSKACDFGCKLLRERAWHPVGLPTARDSAGAVVPAAAEIVAPVVREYPVAFEPGATAPTREGFATKPDSHSELLNESEMISDNSARNHLASAANPVPSVADKAMKRRTRRASEGPIDLSSLASSNHLSVLKAALAGLEQVDVIMSMSARMLGIAQAGTALDAMRETKRRLAALIAEVTLAKSRNET